LNRQTVLYIPVIMVLKAADRPSARDRLLAAADELFYAEGVHVVGVDRIVERAAVTKATLYNTFGSKEDLVRAYLEQHMRRRQERIGRILAAKDSPRGRILAVFAEVEELLAGSSFRGCRFISAAAEARPGDASEVAAAEYRTWLLNVFTDLAKAAGADDAKQLGRRLLLLYDGAAVAARMDRDRDAAARATHSAVIALLDAARASRPARATRRPS
jgi:AcrR family transcriptional regulator